jgi:predicted RNA-binding Zn ribbon-like protein
MTTAVIKSHGASGNHQHEISLDDTFDFLNTIELESGSLVDHLETFDDAARWLLERGVCHRGRGPSALRPAGLRDDQALARVRSVRAALREVAHAVAHERPPDPESLAEVNRAIAARERIELVRAPDGVSVGHSHVGDPLDDALARLADPLVREIGAGRADRVRICANETCRWVFYDESRAGRRRWCSMASCGNRAKAARHRARQKAMAEADEVPHAATLN